MKWLEYSPKEHYKNLHPVLKSGLRETCAELLVNSPLTQCRLRVSGLQRSYTTEPAGEADGRALGAMLAWLPRANIPTSWVTVRLFL